MKIKCKVLSEWLSNVRAKMPRQLLEFVDEAESIAALASDNPEANISAIHRYTADRIIPFMLEVCEIDLGARQLDWSDMSAFSRELFESSWDASTHYHCSRPDALSEAAHAINSFAMSCALLKAKPIQSANCLAHTYKHAVSACWEATTGVGTGAKQARTRDVFDRMIGEMFDCVVGIREVA